MGFCSLQVPNGFPSGSNMLPRFPMCSLRVFPIAPRFNPICFDQSPPLLTYIAGPKREILHVPTESFSLRSIYGSNFLMQWANQIGLLEKKKMDLLGHPQLININHTVSLLLLMCLKPYTGTQ